MINLLKAKKKYNKLIAREKKAELYLNNPNIPVEKIMKWIPEYQKILKQLSVLEMYLKSKV